jgi:hypothetical protein
MKIIKNKKTGKEQKVSDNEAESILKNYPNRFTVTDVVEPKLPMEVQKKVNDIEVNEPQQVKEAKENQKK